MATITIKNMPDDLFERLKQSAEAHQRSINDEIIACLDWSFPSQKTSPEAVLVKARQLRGEAKGYILGDDEFTALKAMGRL